MRPEPDERAALRAYLQRSEVRLSTIHRTATALLSGAGVLVLLPALGRDSIVTVLKGLLTSADSPLHLVLALLVVLTLGLVLVVVWLLLLELAKFFFHANHLASDRGTTFTPRFTLTSLHLPVDDLGEVTRAALDERRADASNIELLVPSNATSRRNIDAQIAAYEGLELSPPVSDASRAEALLRLAGVKDRTLVDEVAKVEYGMARHVLRIQVVVLRYIKALLVTIVTVLEVFVIAAVVERSPTVDRSAERWTVAVLMLWAPAVLFVTSSPVRWLGQLLRTEGAAASGIRYDRELTRLERVASFFSMGVVAVALVCAVVLLTEPSSTEGLVSFLVVVIGGLLLEGWLVVRSRG